MIGAPRLRPVPVLALRQPQHGPAVSGNYCRAFPGGIPQEFQLNRVDHREPVDYDGGIRYELVPEANPQGAYLRLDAYFHNRKLAEAEESGT